MIMLPKIHPITAFSLPEVNQERLANGVTFLTYNAGAMDTCALSLVWPGGIVEATALSHEPLVPVIASRTLCEGAGGLSGMQIAEALDFGGANFMADAEPHYCLLNMTMLTRMADSLLPLLRSIIVEPEFPDNAVSSVLERTYHQHLMSKKKVGFLAHYALAKLIDGEDNPMAYMLTDADFENVSRQKLIDFHHNVYTASGCVAMLSGKISPEMLAATKAMLESLPAKEPACPLVVEPFVAAPPQQAHVEKADAMQSAVRMGIPGPDRSHPDYQLLRLVVRALGGYFGSRLMKNIREDKGYTYGINAALEGNREGSVISISADCAPEHVEPLIQEVRFEMERLANEPMGADELERLRMNAATSLMQVLETPFSIMDYHRVMLMYGLPADYFDNQVQTILTLTPADIMRIAGAYLRPSELRIAVAGR